MKNSHEAALRIRLAAITILGLFIVLAAAAYLGGRQVELSSQLLDRDAVPGTIDAHFMRMAMSRSIGWVMVAASAQTTQSRDASLKIVHDADEAFADYVKQYETTIRIDPAKDRALLDRVKRGYAEYYRQRMTYEALILAGDRDGSAVFLERDLVPAYLPAIKSAEELLNYNHANSITYANYIHNSVRQLHWMVAVVVVLALICASVLIVNLSIRRREMMELRESEEKFAKAFRLNPSGISITEMETGEYMEVNESFCRIMGYSPQELIGCTSVELRIWSGVADRKQVFASLLDGNMLRNLELQTRTRDGESKTVLVNAELIEWSGKKCILSLVQDITERKQAEQQLRASEELFRTSFESATVGVCLVARDGRFLKVNRTMCDMLGYAKEELLQLTFNDVTHEEDQEIGLTFLGNTLSGGSKTMQVEKRYLHKDGRVVWAFLSTALIEQSGEHGGYLISYVQDITERKRAVEQIEMLKVSVDQHFDAAFWMDTSNRFVYVNDSACKALGYTREELLGQAVAMVSPTATPQILEEIWKHCGKRGSSGVKACTVAKMAASFRSKSLPRMCVLREKSSIAVSLVTSPSANGRNKP